MKMKWFSAVLVVECKIGKAKPHRWESQIRVIRAQNADEAYSAALSEGEKESFSYNNQYGEIVKWRFIGIADLAELLLNRISNGTEIYCQSNDKRPQIPRKSSLFQFSTIDNLSKPNRKKALKELDKFTPK